MEELPQAPFLDEIAEIQIGLVADEVVDGHGNWFRAHEYRDAYFLPFPLAPGFWAWRSIGKTRSSFCSALRSRSVSSSMLAGLNDCGTERGGNSLNDSRKAITPPIPW